MKIQDIQIDGFGVWHDRQWEGLSDHFNVFVGGNEAGKTTLMSFIRSVLFGFERRNHPRRYEPLAGGNHGGWLRVDCAQGRVRIERTAGRHVRGKVLVHHDGGTDDERMLEQLMCGTTRTLYHNVFAFGLEELEHFRTLEDSEVAAHISGAGLGVGAKRWSAVWKDLEDRRSSLFLPRGQTSTINRALKELESVREELDRTESDPDAYIQAHEDRTRLDAQVAELGASAEGLRKKVAYYEKLRETEPHRRRREEIGRALDSVEAVERFPDGGVERLNMLLHQRRLLDAELAQHESECRAQRSERVDLASEYNPQELIRRTRAVESLRALLPRRESTDEIVRAASAARDAVAGERAAVMSRLESAQPPSSVAMGAFMTLVGIVSAGFVYADRPEIAAAVAGIIVVLAWWYRGKLVNVRRIRTELARATDRLRAASGEVGQAGARRAELLATISGLTGKVDFTLGDLGRAEERAERLNKIADRIRVIDETMAGEDRKGDGIRSRIRDNGGSVAGLLAEAGAPSESDFFRRAELFRQRQELLTDLARTPSGDVAPVEGLDPAAGADDRVLSEAAGELASMDELLGQARADIGRLEERIGSLGRSEERSRARLRQEAILARIDDASERWAVLTLCRTLLDETRRVYETERQPEVLRQASEFFRNMSDGRWVRVIAPLGSAEILVESDAGRRLNPANLSRGTGEQLYLAMRLALVGEYSRHVEPLPIVFDDIFVNFDPVRTRRSIEAVRDLSETHQILLFTCHPHLLELIQEIVPSAKVYPLQ